MSTHCRVAETLPDGTLRSVYCHFDGYPDGVGASLRRSVTTPKQVRALVDRGDLRHVNYDGTAVAMLHGWPPRFSQDLHALRRLTRDTGGAYLYVFAAGAWLEVAP